MNEITQEKPKLAVDIDETITPLLPFFLEYYNNKYNTSFQIENFKSYRWWETLNLSKEKTYREANLCFKEISSSCEKDYFTELNFLEYINGAQQGIELLHRFYELHGVTARTNELYPQTHMISTDLYVDDSITFFPELPLKPNEEDLILPVENIHYSSSELPKSTICKKLGIQKIIEDDKDVAIECSNNGIEVILLERPWNKDIKTNNLITKVKSWQEITNHLVVGTHKLPNFKEGPYSVERI